MAGLRTQLRVRPGARRPGRLRHPTCHPSRLRVRCRARRHLRASTAWEAGAQGSPASWPDPPEEASRPHARFAGRSLTGSPSGCVLHLGLRESDRSRNQARPRYRAAQRPATATTVSATPVRNRRRYRSSPYQPRRATSQSASSASTVIGTQSAVEAPGLTTRAQDVPDVKGARYHMPGGQHRRSADHDTCSRRTWCRPYLGQAVIPDRRHNRLTPRLCLFSGNIKRAWDCLARHTDPVSASAPASGSSLSPR